MKKLNQFELEQVSGGVLPLALALALGMSIETWKVGVMQRWW